MYIGAEKVAVDVGTVMSDSLAMAVQPLTYGPCASSWA